MGIGSVLLTFGINNLFLASLRLCQRYIPERSSSNASSGSALLTTDEVEEVEE
jgi:hypothetical protein